MSPRSATNPVVLEIDELTVSFTDPRTGANLRGVTGVSLAIADGETVGVVGESGSGKSITFLTVLGLMPSPPANVDDGRAWFEGEDLLASGQARLAKIRGAGIGLVFQDPTAALNPVYTIGHQIAEAIRLHDRSLDDAEVRRRVASLLTDVGIGEAERYAAAYPHELSGGMRQRVLIAMAVANRPRLLIADEPTTALDVSVQAGILDLFKEIQATSEMAVVLISHDLGLLAERVDRVVVMYAGRIVEDGPTTELYERPFHPYTRGLLSVVPRPDLDLDVLPTIPGESVSNRVEILGCAFQPRCALAAGREICRSESPPLRVVTGRRAVACHFAEELMKPEPPMASGLSRRTAAADTSAVAVPPILEVRGLEKTYRSRRTNAKAKPAVRDATFHIGHGETLGLVGESGSGKSTIGQCIVRLLEPDNGEILVNGTDIAHLPQRDLRPFRRQLQYVFQDPGSSLDPRLKVRDLLREPLIVARIKDGHEETIEEIVSLVGLSTEHLDRYPHEFSGGQAQRLALARALVLRPGLLILDEPVSALDVSVQAQVINLLKDLQSRLGLAYLFISHDLGVVRHLSNRVAVMNAGEIVEIGSTGEVFDRPNHEYTRHLLASLPRGSINEAIE